MTEHKTWFCDFCNKKIEPFRNGFNELSIDLWQVIITKIRLNSSENAFAPDKPKNGDMCKECLSKLPSQNNEDGVLK